MIMGKPLIPVNLLVSSPKVQSCSVAFYNLLPLQNFPRKLMLVAPRFKTQWWCSGLLGKCFSPHACKGLGMFHLRSFLCFHKWTFSSLSFLVLTSFSKSKTFFGAYVPQLLNFTSQARRHSELQQFLSFLFNDKCQAYPTIACHAAVLEEHYLYGFGVHLNFHFKDNLTVDGASSCIVLRSIFSIPSGPCRRFWTISLPWTFVSPFHQNLFSRRPYFL